MNLRIHRMFDPRFKRDPVCETPTSSAPGFIRGLSGMGPPFFIFILRDLKCDERTTLPIGSMYAIYGNIYHQYTPNVSIYTIITWILWVIGYIPCLGGHPRPFLSPPGEIGPLSQCYAVTRGKYVAVAAGGCGALRTFVGLHCPKFIIVYLNFGTCYTWSKWAFFFTHLNHQWVIYDGICHSPFTGLANLRGIQLSSSKRDCGSNIFSSYFKYDCKVHFVSPRPTSGHF